MKILQVATTRDRPCGVGNFALTMETALHRIGIKVETVIFPDQNGHAANLTVIHHQAEIFDDSTLEFLVYRCPRPVVLFAHSPGAERFDGLVDAFIAMSDGAVRDPAKACCIFPHPAWIPPMIVPRDVVRSRLGLPINRVILGTSGFLTPGRQLPHILKRLLPAAVKSNWLITLVTSRWQELFRRLEDDLTRLADEFPNHLIYDTEFLPAADLNARLQACDLLWCWTNTPSGPYASGSASDQYASGTRLVVASKKQHEHILQLPNTVAAPTTLYGFTQSVINEATRGYFPRHDPSLISWTEPTKKLSDFLIGLAKRDT